MRLDAHQHFWLYNPTDYVWMSDEQPMLKRDFTPDDLAPLLKEIGFDGSIAVQAREMVKETEWLLALADQHPLIKGVVGWVDLCDPNVGRDIARFAAHPKLKGFRVLIHDQPDPDFSISPAHQRGIKLLGEHRLTYDLLLKPPHLKPATQLVDNFPQQKFVVDHIAKPDIKRQVFSPWREAIAELAKRPNVFCKLSGLVTEADWRHWNPQQIVPYLEIVLEAFGPHRLMIGSDWPVCTCAALYAKTMRVVLDWSRQFSPAEQADILGGACARFYG